MAHEFERPKRIIRIHADITDGPIPSLSFNPENLQLSYNWREMFTIFYGEQRIYHKLLDAWAKEHEDGVLDLEIWIERMTLDALNAPTEHEHAASNNRDFKTARRVRIRQGPSDE